MAGKRAGGGGLQPMAQAIMADSFEPHKRGQAFALYGLVAVLAPSIGPTLGGYITDNFSWRWIFFINIPVGIVAFIALGKLFGLAPAALGCVFISSLGDRTATVKSAAVLAIVTSLFAVGFFSYVLGIQFPVWQWPALGSGP